ncbi:hypothetical protein MHYP_G00144430 [Metynnis hypsauchen]
MKMLVIFGILVMFTEAGVGDIVFVSVWVLEITVLLSLLGGFHIYARIQRKQTKKAAESKEQKVEEDLYTNLDQEDRQHH